MGMERQRLSELLYNLLAPRMPGGVEVENAARMILDDEEAVHLAVIPEECQPVLHLRLVGLALQPLQIARHGGFRNVDSELQQLPMDARRTPGWILGFHAPNEMLNVHSDTRATETFRPRPPSPE